MLDFFVFIILSFAAYRITRLIVIDAIFEGTRERFHSFLINRSNKKGFAADVWDKVLYLTSCTWCVGIWVSFFLYAFYAWDWPIDWTRHEWVFIFSIAGLQGLLHAWEPDED